MLKTSRIHRVVIAALAVTFLLSINLSNVQAVGNKTYDATLTGDITGTLQICGNIRARPPTSGWATLNFGGILGETVYAGDHYGHLSLSKNHFSFSWKTDPDDPSQWYYLKGDVTSFRWNKATKTYIVTFTNESFIITVHTIYPTPIWSGYLTFTISFAEI